MDANEFLGKLNDYFPAMNWEELYELISVPADKSELNTLLCKINNMAFSDETWLEPYIGMTFPIIKKGKTVSWVDWYGEKRKLENKYLDFV